MKKDERYVPLPRRKAKNQEYTANYPESGCRNYTVLVYLCQGVRAIENRLRELRKRHNYTQLKVALDLDLSQNSISRYETGAHEAGYELLIRFAEYYGVSIDYLLGRTDDPRYYP